MEKIKYTIDMVEGKQFGRLTGLTIFRKPLANGKGWQRHVACVCECECGKLCSPQVGDLFRRKQISCGCKREESNKAFIEEWQGLKGRLYGYIKNKELLNDIHI